MASTFILVMDVDDDPDTWNAVAEASTLQELLDLGCYDPEEPSIFYDKRLHPEISSKRVSKPWCGNRNTNNPGTIYEIKS